MSPQRNVKPGLLEYKNVLRPVRIELDHVDTDGVVVNVRNMLDFSELSDKIIIKYRMIENGDSNDLRLIIFNVLPHKSKKLKLITCFKKTYSNKQIYFEYFSKENNESLGFEVLTIERNYDFLEPEIKPLPLDAFNTLETSDSYIIRGLNFEYTFSKYSANFVSLKKNTIEILEDELEWNIWRAPTDNDMHIKNSWYGAGYDKVTQKVLSVKFLNKLDSVILESVTQLTSGGCSKILEIKATWEISSNGIISLKANIEKNPVLPALPCFGLRLFLSPQYETFGYWGYGKGQSYIDMHEGTYEGLFNSSAKEEYIDYIFPQEQGNHFGVRKLIFDDFGFYFPKPCEINVSHYTSEELTQKKHNFELKADERVILCINAKQNGIGSNSCGPSLPYKYQFDQIQFSFETYLF